VVILTASIQEEQLLEALRLGVRGVVLKEMAPALLVQCVRKVHSGGQWIERDSARRALEKILERQAGARALGEFLTSREAQIVTLIAKGMRNKEIAEKLFISEGTVKIHLHNIYEKLGVDGRLALMRYTQEKGLV